MAKNDSNSIKALKIVSLMLSSAACSDDIWEAHAGLSATIDPMADMLYPPKRPQSGS